MSASFWNSLPRPILALAPMEGFTDSAFRLLARQHGADVVYTEFMPSDAIAYGARRVLEKMAFDAPEQPVICQIFGRDIENFRQAAQAIEQRGFSGIDINFGCPARKVVGSGSGVALLRDPHYARQLIETVLEATTLPVSIKVRASIRKERREVAPSIKERVTALDLVDAISDLPVAAIMVHGRSFEGGFSGSVDTDMIGEIKHRFHGLVIANGGIQSPDDAVALLTATGADGVGIARGALGQPWIFEATRARLAGQPSSAPAWETIAATMLAHAKQALANKGPYGLIELRKHLAAYVKGRRNASALRRALVQIRSIDDIKRALASEADQGAQAS